MKAFLAVVFQAFAFNEAVADAADAVICFVEVQLAVGLVFEDVAGDVF